MIRTSLLKILHWLARPVVVFYTLPWLLVLLTLGTVAQRYIGLYHSEKLFFGSFILWIGPVPLPGAYTTLLLLSLALTAKLILKSPLRKRLFGTLLTHASVLLLMVGGLVSALTREEGNMVLYQEQTSAIVSDYYAREVAIQKDSRDLLVIPFSQLMDGQPLKTEGLPFSIHVRQRCYPCAAVPLDAPKPEAFGMAAAMKLVDAQPSPEDALNRAGAMIDVTGAGKGMDGEYIIFESLSKPPELEVSGNKYVIVVRAAQRLLPFTVTLQQFEQENHPGTRMAREYRSVIELKDGGLQWKESISMNQPLRYRGYTLYQSSFIEDGEKTASVLAVVKNEGWLFPYISVAILTVGLLLHLVLRGRNAGKAVVVMLLLACMLPINPAQASDLPAFDYTVFSRLPVLHEGRIKPIESFARALLKGMSGSPNPANASAEEWLAEVLFSPQQAAQRPVFAINNPVLINALGIQKRSGRYSFSELLSVMGAQDEAIQKLLAREAKTYSDSERELVHLYEMVTLYAELMGSFTLLTPMEGVSLELRKELGLPENDPVSFYSTLKARRDLMEKLKAVVARKKSDVARYTPLEQDIAQLAYRLDGREAMHRTNRLFRVIPGEWDNKEEWLSPWQVVVQHAGSPQSAGMFALWEQMQGAWHDKDASAWKTASTKLQQEMLKVKGANGALLELEVQYHEYHPLMVAMVLYGLAILMALGALALRRDVLDRLASLAMLLALAAHGVAMLMRIVILGRPPVSTLYESMLFVSLVGAVCGMYLAWRKGIKEGILAGALVAIAVLFFAGIFDGKGDTLEMLTAVLNTNFWLGTHVVCITAGYGFSLITGVIAHFYLFRRGLATPQEDLVGQYRLLQVLALWSLVFTTVGTMLGGIWADQSWGRFWGWDPKENGALAIVIWLTWALHGRLSGHLRETAFAAMLALTTIVVAIAWVGVNLLSVGLHSYGFSDAAAWGLPLFCITEIVIVGILAMLSAQQYRAIRQSSV